MRRILVIAACALWLGSCCQSIWFTVYKGNPEVRPWLPMPQIASPPIPQATFVTNRFDVLKGGQRTVLFPLFTDEVTLEDSDTLGSAINEREAMERLFGVPHEAPELRGIESATVDAEVSCDIDATSTSCKYLSVTAPFKVSAPLFVRIRTKDAVYVRAIRSCSKGLTGEDVKPCKSQDRGSNVTVTHHIPVKSKTRVQITFFSSEISETAFTFVHLSDVQLRDPTVTLTDAELSHRLDRLIPSFEYDYDQAFYGRYVVEALFATINAEATRFDKDDPRRPAFVMHTGDSIDSGMKSELLEFHGLVDGLKIPFYNALGNHDLLVFGNLLPVATRDSDATCVDARSLAAHYLKYFRKKRRILPDRLCVDQQIKCENCAADEAGFVAQPKIEDSRAKFIDGFSHGEHAVMQQEPPRWPPTWTCDDRLGVKLQPLSFNHGLDLNASKGHYAFARQIQLAGQVRHLVFLVLDTEDLPPNTGGAGGVMGQGQIDWVRDVLKCVQPNDLVLVFSHHSLGEVQTAKSATCPVEVDGKVTQVACNELESLFANNKHVVGHFYGHNHTHGLCRNGRPTTCTQFWEIETGAMIEFPQEARLVHLEYLGSGLAYFDVTTFGERLEGVENELTRAVARGRRGAERDYCHTHTDIKCSPDLHVQRQDGRHTNARLFFRLPETR